MHPRPPEYELSKLCWLGRREGSVRYPPSGSSAIAVRYGAAVLSTLAVTFIARELDGVWDTSHLHPYLVEWPVIILAAWIGGLGPGLVATVLSTLAIFFYWVEPIRSLRVSHPSALVAVVLYAFCGVVVSILIDNLHLARAEELRARRSRENVLGIVAHDLRNPLNAIILGAASLRRKPGDTRRLDAMERAAARMQRLIQDLLDASVLDNDSSLNVVLADEDVASLVAEAVNAASAEATAKGISLTAETKPGLRARCDRERLLQVLGNLLSNAAKFTPEGGSITVRAILLNAWVRLEVSDTGPGIKSEDEASIFVRNWTGGMRGSGAGLGLYIAHGLVRAHGGQIWVHGERGHGTTFFLTIPAVDAEPNGSKGRQRDRLLLS